MCDATKAAFLFFSPAHKNSNSTYYICRMQACTPYLLRNQTFWLSPQRCVYWEEEKILIVADLHFGKSGHFRKAGIPVPQDVFKKDLHTLFHCIQFFQPKQLIIVGDMFHSKANKEMDLFARWRSDIGWLHLSLVKGNHDILHNSFYANNAIEVFNETLSINDVAFVHDIVAVNFETTGSNYFFSGHIHPGVSIHGGSRQSISMPCFYFSQQYAVLPAFSGFAGYCIVRPKKSDAVFAIAGTNVMKL